MVTIDAEDHGPRSDDNDGDGSPEFCTQHGFAFRSDWGPQGLQALARDSAVVIVIDVLRFTTAVCCALEAGGSVLPYRWNDGGAAGYAMANHATLAGRREQGDLSLSPTDLLCMPSGTRLVLPSPNGSALAFAARDMGVRHVLAGCLRNASATAAAAHRLANGGPISVIAAGERWGTHDGPLRPAVEDLLGAGAVLTALDPSASLSQPGCSPEAAAARAAFLAARPLLYPTLCATASGRELLGRGWDDDLATAAAHDVSTMVCRLAGPEFVPLL